MRALASFSARSALASVAIASAVAVVPPPAAAQEGPRVRGPRLAPADVAWEVPLDRAPSAPPRGVATQSGPRVLLADPAGIAARHAADGSPAWRLRGTRADGLGLAAPGPSGRAIAGWSGSDPDGAPRLALVDLATGEVLASHALPGAPTGAPLHVVDDGAEAWLVPLGEGRVAALSMPSGEAAVLSAPAPVRPPLLEGPDRPLAISGSPPALRDLLRRPHRALATGLASRSTATRGAWVYGALGRTLCGHRCRVTRRGRLRCSRRWCQELAAEMVAPPLVTGDVVIAGARDTFAYAFRGETGHLAWRSQVGQRVEHTPLAWRGMTLVVPVAGRRITALDLRDGRSAGQIDAGPGETFSGGGALSGDMLVVVVERPPETYVLRAYTLSTAAGTQPEEEDAAASTSSPRSAARNRSSSIR